MTRSASRRRRPTGSASLAGLAALILALVCPNASDAAAHKDSVVRYDNHEVIRVIPTTDGQVSALSRLANQDHVDVWSKRLLPSVPWDIMVGPDTSSEVKKALRENHLDWKVLVSDLGRALASPSEEAQTASSAASASRAASGAAPRYLKYNEVMQYLDELAKQYPKMVKAKTIGRSSEGRDLKLVHISTGRDAEGKAKPAVWVDAGIHAREWIAPATALYITHQLVENATHTAHLTRDVDWYILPLFNPDGYEYSHTTDRLWRKTRSKTWWGLGCSGADANRNFDFHWREVGASWTACSATYAGSKAFSEPEARAVRDFLLAHKDHIKMYLTYHSYGNFLLYPWGYTSTLPNDWKTLDSLAQKANKAMVAAGSDPYTIGSSTNVLYAAAGGSDDWAKAVAGIQLSYTIELPGGNGHGFDLPPSYIPSVGHHQMQAIEVLASHVAQKD